MLAAIVEGSGPSSETEEIKVHYFKSNDPQISADGSDGQPIVTKSSASQLNAGISSIVSITLVPSDAESVYYGACVESSLEESNTLNNCSEGVEVTVKPLPVTRPIYMWLTYMPRKGYIGDRNAADQLCAEDPNAAYLPAGADYQHKAVIAYPQDLPHNFEIANKDSRELQRPDGTLIANRYEQFFDASYTLQASVSDTEQAYWTGLSRTNPQAAREGENCGPVGASWTSQSVSYVSSWGRSTASGSERYWAGNYPQACNAELRVLCISH